MAVKYLPRILLVACAIFLRFRTVDAALPPFPPHLSGSADAVSELLERVLPGSSTRFELAVDTALACPRKANCFELADSFDGLKTVVTGTTASEVAAGVGLYLREWCGMTIGWTRGGGRHVFIPSRWPAVGRNLTRARSVPYSHVTQVRLRRSLPRATIIYVYIFLSAHTTLMVGGLSSLFMQARTPHF